MSDFPAASITGTMVFDNPPLTAALVRVHVAMQQQALADEAAITRLVAGHGVLPRRLRREGSGA